MGREHVWPKSLGVGSKGPDYTDVHCLRPSDWSVNSARGNKYFGECGKLHDMSECKMPAHPEAAKDTATDPSIWLPPSNVRGDLARALMYMAIRYDGDDPEDNDSYDLELSDCPPNINDGSYPGKFRYMAYLSELMTWHQEDPVDSYERERNNDVCENWQGNRNPFVDFPELANYYFGSTSGYDGYNCVDAPGPRECSDLSIMIIGFKSDNPDEVNMVALTDIAPNVAIYLTDNFYDGEGIGSNEGIMKYVVPQPGISAGSIISYTDGDNTWQKEKGNFALSTVGDNMFLYCERPSNDMRFLNGIIYTDGGWLTNDVNISALTSSTSFLPSNLASASISLDHYDNYDYIGTRNGTIDELKENLTNKNNWKGFNNPALFSLNLTKFDVQNSKDSTIDNHGSSTISNYHSAFKYLLLGLISILFIF